MFHAMYIFMPCHDGNIATRSTQHMVENDTEWEHEEATEENSATQHFIRLKMKSGKCFILFWCVLFVILFLWQQPYYRRRNIVHAFWHLVLLFSSFPVHFLMKKKLFFFILKKSLCNFCMLNMLWFSTSSTYTHTETKWKVTLPILNNISYFRMLSAVWLFYIFVQVKVFTEIDLLTLIFFRENERFHKNWQQKRLFNALFGVFLRSLYSFIFFGLKTYGQGMKIKIGYFMDYNRHMSTAPMLQDIHGLSLAKTILLH